MKRDASSLDKKRRAETPGSGESAGATAEVHVAADARLRIPLRAGLCSLNLAIAAAMVLDEALRQTEGFPP